MLADSVGAAEGDAAIRQVRGIATGKGEMSGCIAGELLGSCGKH